MGVIWAGFVRFCGCVLGICFFASCHRSAPELWVDLRPGEESGVPSERPEPNACNKPIDPLEMPNIDELEVGPSEAGFQYSGQGQVDARGVFHYSLPIAVVPGVSGMQPALSLRYSSESGIGYAGHGFNLEAAGGSLSAIQRCPKRQAFGEENVPVSALAVVENDEANEAEDALCMGQARLIEVSENRFVVQGNTHAVVWRKRGPNGSSYFIGFQPSSGGAGRITRYGGESQSRIGGIHAAVVGQAPKPYIWAADTVSDLEGNAMKVRYTGVYGVDAEVGDAPWERNAEYYPELIAYGGKVVVNIRYGESPQQVQSLDIQAGWEIFPRTEVRFLWQPLEEGQSGFMGRQRIGKTKRLSQVESFLRESAQAQQVREEHGEPAPENGMVSLRRTVFTYGTDALKDRIVSAHACSRAELSAAWQCSAEERLVWEVTEESASFSFDDGETMDWNMGMLRMFQSADDDRGPSEADHPLYFADLDGDGVPDMYYPKPSAGVWAYALNNGAGGFQEERETTHPLLDYRLNNHELFIPGFAVYDGCTNGRTEVCNVPIHQTSPVNLDGHGRSVVLALGGGQWMDPGEELVQLRLEEGDFATHTTSLAHGLELEEPSVGRREGVVYGPYQSGRWSPSNVMDFDGDGQPELVSFYRAYGAENRAALDGNMFGKVESIRLRRLHRAEGTRGQIEFGEEELVWLDESRRDHVQGELRYRVQQYEIGLGELEGSAGDDVVLMYPESVDEGGDDTELRMYVGSYISREAEQIRRVRMQGLHPEQWLSGAERLEHAGEARSVLQAAGWRRGKKAAYVNYDALTDFFVWHHNEEDEGDHGIAAVVNRGGGEFVRGTQISGETLELYGHLHEEPLRREHMMKLSFQESRAVDLNLDGRSELVYPCEQPPEVNLIDVLGDGGLSEEDAERIEELQRQGALSRTTQLCILWWEGSMPRVSHTGIAYSRHEENPSLERSWKLEAEMMSERSSVLHVMAFVDVDVDGDLDLVYRHESDGPLTIYRNQHRAPTLVGLEHMRPDGSYEPTLQVEYAPLRLAPRGWYQVPRREDRRIGGQGDPAPYVSLAKSGWRMVSSVRRSRGHQDDGEIQWHEVRYRYGTIDRDVLNARIIGPRWHEAEDMWTGKTVRTTYGFSREFNSSRHAFLFAGLPSEVLEFAVEAGLRRRLVRKATYEAPRYHAVDMVLGRADWVEPGIAQVWVYAVDGEAEDVPQAWELEGREAEEARVRGWFRVEQGAMLQFTRVETEFNEHGHVELQRRWVRDPGAEGLVIREGGERYTRKEEVLMSYTEGDWGLWGQVSQLTENQTGGDSHVLEEKSKTKRQDMVYNDEAHPWRLTKVRHNDVDAIAPDQKRVEVFGYDDTTSRRGHVVRLEQHNGYPEGSVDHEVRIRRVEYDTEGFAPECLVTQVREGFELVTTQRVDRSLGQVQRVRDPNGVRQQVWHDGLGRPFAMASTAGTGHVVVYGAGADTWHVRKAFLSGPQIHEKYDTQRRLVERAWRSFGQAQVPQWYKQVYRYDEGSWRRGGEQQGVVHQLSLFGPFEVQVEAVEPLAENIPEEVTSVERQSADRWGRPLIITRVGLAPITFDYDYDPQTRTQIHRVTDAGQYVWETHLDGLGRVVKRIEPEVEDLSREAGAQRVQCSLQYKYNAFHQPVEVDVCGQQTMMGYDRLGRITWIQHPDSEGVFSKYYNSFGEVVRTEESQGLRVDVTYDGLGRKVSESRLLLQEDAGVIRETRNYDYDQGPYALGKLVRAYNIHSTKEYGYDSTGRLNAWVVNVQPLGEEDEHYRFDLAYNGFGQLIRKTYPEVQPEGLRLRQQYQYDAASGVLTTISSGWEDQPFHHVWELGEMNSHGQVTQTILGNGLVRSATYDAQTGQRTQFGVGFAEDMEGGFFPRVQHHSMIREDGTLGYDTRGLLRYQRDEVQGEQTHFSYDALARLTRVERQRSRLRSVERIDYDVWGNTLQKAVHPFEGEARAMELNPNEWKVRRYQYRGAGDAGPNQVQSVRIFTSEAGLDVGGWLAERRELEPEQVYTYTTQGHAESYRGQALTYGTHGGQPESIEEIQSGLVHQYLYDAFGQRLQKRVVWEDQEEAALDVLYLKGLIREKKPGGGVSVRMFTPTPDGGTVVVHRVQVNAEGDSTFDEAYFHRDGVGTVEVITDEAGQVVQGEGVPMMSDVWGQFSESWALPEQRISSAQQRQSDMGFTGHLSESELGLVSMGARQYAPELGRFLASDAVLPNLSFSQAFNRYAYSYNNPIHFVDPDGRTPVPLLDAGPAVVFIPPLVEAFAAWMTANAGTIVAGAAVTAVVAHEVATHSNPQVRPFPPVAFFPENPGGDGGYGNKDGKGDKGKGPKNPPEFGDPVAIIDVTPGAFQAVTASVVSELVIQRVEDRTEPLQVPLLFVFMREAPFVPGSPIFPYRMLGNSTFDGIFPRTYVMNVEEEDGTFDLNRVRENVKNGVLVTQRGGMAIVFFPYNIEDTVDILGDGAWSLGMSDEEQAIRLLQNFIGAEAGSRVHTSESWVMDGNSLQDYLFLGGSHLGEIFGETENDNNLNLFPGSIFLIQTERLEIPID